MDGWVKGLDCDRVTGRIGYVCKKDGGKSLI